MFPFPIIFLDIDGVLIPYGKDSRTLHAPCLAALVSILSQTSARIVVSSSWRLYNMPELMAMFRVVMLPTGETIADRVIGTTPWSDQLLDDNIVSRCRPKEIRAWVDEHQFTGTAVIIDDETLHGVPYPHVKTQLYTGLTENHVSAIVRYLTETE